MREIPNRYDALKRSHSSIAGVADAEQADDYVGGGVRSPARRPAYIVSVYEDFSGLPPCYDRLFSRPATPACFSPCSGI